MSAAEVAYRLARIIATKLERGGLRTFARVPSPRVAAGGRPFVLGGGGVDAAPYLAAADAVVTGKLRIFAIDYAIGTTPRWNRDPKSGREAPLVFGKSIDYRSESLVGDIKYLWEPNRHLHLVTLAQAWRASEDRKYLECLARHVDSWLEQCPFAKGPNWTSSLELGIRLINWSVVWQLTGGSASPLFEGTEGEKLRSAWLNSIYQHLHFIRGHLSRYSSANNHLIGEAAGLFIGALTWPCWDACQRWSSDAQEILEREALLQNGTDGVNFEQAISYQQFVLDFLVLAGLAGKANGRDFSDGYWKRIEAMVEYLASIMDVRGNVPMIGDADDGYVVRMSQESDFDPYRSMIATGAVLFGREDFRAKAGRLDDKTRWLLGAEAEAKFQQQLPKIAPLPVRRSFADGGYYILGCDFESDREVRAIVDAGPLGYLSIAAHGHADALALTLSVGGREFLIDPGTYAYHTQKNWRDYFRGTAAHNTVEVDGENQSVIGGNFMWLGKADARCEIWAVDDAVDRFVGSHDGYRRLGDPVLHRREIVFVRGDRRFRVVDTLDCKSDHRVKCHWHFSELCELELRGDVVTATNAGQTVSLKLIEPGGEIKLHRGESEPPRGWISRRFDVRVPTTTVSVTIPIRGTTSMVTEIACD